MVEIDHPLNNLIILNKHEQLTTKYKLLQDDHNPSHNDEEGFSEKSANQSRNGEKPSQLHRCQVKKISKS